MRRSMLLGCAVAAGLIALPPAAEGHAGAGPATLAVIGDVPYGAEQIAGFPADIAEINADPAVGRAIHLGDIKNGSSRCDDTYFTARLADFQTFADPLVYTPGDNEWTDCHRASNGAYVPTERLAKLRELFFSHPGRTLGGAAEVEHQSRRFPENTSWTQAGVTFGAVHVVGSNDGRLPWYGDRTDAAGQPAPETPAETRLRTREYVLRELAGLLWVDRLFDEAARRRSAGLVIAMQADMWDASAAPEALTAYEPHKRLIADRAARFVRPVLLLEGDSHTFLVDRPAGMPANVTRLVVQGSTVLPREWLRLEVDPRAAGVFSCENVRYRTGEVVPCPAPLAP